mmetsp:Transcript_2213/g.8679  ORF Transcript_2213/g.8679 Transcript_2213/m.8679 type:complete len:202 (+) Transcript_2213:2-607(+)
MGRARELEGGEAKAARVLDFVWVDPVPHSGPGGGDDAGVELARGFRGDDRRDHHEPAAARRGGDDRARREHDDRVVAVLGCILGVLERDSVVDCARVLPRPRVHQDGFGQPHRVQNRELVRQIHARFDLLLGVLRSFARASHSFFGRTRGWYLLAPRQGALRRVRLRSRQRHGEEDGRVRHDHRVPNLYDLFRYVHHRHGR